TSVGGVAFAARSFGPCTFGVALERGFGTVNKPVSSWRSSQQSRNCCATSGDSMITALLLCPQRPVGVQFVLPVITACGLPLPSTKTANLLWPMWPLLNIRLESVRPAVWISSSRNFAFSSSHSLLPRALLELERIR